MIQKVFETHLDVRDLARSIEFYRDTLGLELAMVEETRRIAFFWLGGSMNSMLGLWEQREGQIFSRHTAFEVGLEALGPEIGRLNAAGVKTYDFWKQETASPFVFGWMPAAAIYFDDPDGHWLELIARLPGDQHADHPVISMESWRELAGRPTDGGIENARK